MKKSFGTQQVLIQPPKGYVPPLRNELTPIAVYNNATGYWVGLPIEALIEALVEAEQKHILGILDGREENYDLQTITIPNGAVDGDIYSEQLTVPDDKVWFVTAIALATPADDGGVPSINWRCSLWIDRVGASVNGQLYHRDYLSATPLGDTFYDECFAGAPFLGGPEPLFPPTNKPYPLRLPPGTKLTFDAASIGAAATGDMVCTARLFGHIGKYLVP